MKRREWDNEVLKEKGFILTVYSQGKVEIMASIYENRIMLHSDSGDVYKVVNGPIKMNEFVIYDDYDK